MVGDWTRHVDSYVAQLEDAGLIPPINGVHVAERQGGAVLVLEVSVPISDVLAAQIGGVLASVPHELRHLPFAEDGRRSGVDYA